ncbi:MAG: hypothetical protein MH321_16080 [Leptospiraceae bacterium]|nr:hypothetical protein [Leptospiraceae bacterium]
MKRITIIILFSLALFECHNADRDEIKRGQDLFLFSIAMAGFFRPNFCEPAQLILEEGQTYNITLEPGKPFYIDFDVRSKFGSNVLLDLELTINKDSTTSFDYISEDDCDSEVRPLPVKPFINDSTQVKLKSRAYGYSNGVGMNTDGYYIILNSGKEILSISYSRL